MICDSVTLLSNFCAVFSLLPNRWINLKSQDGMLSVESQKGYQYSKMFHWEPEGRYHHRLCIVIAPFWFWREHLWIFIMPFWLSIDDMVYWMPRILKQSILTALVGVGKLVIWYTNNLCGSWSFYEAKKPFFVLLVYMESTQKGTEGIKISKCFLFI